MSSPTYCLTHPDHEVVVPVLDEHQQRVVDHPGGPLLVLAGPGTGKTTTLVEAIVDRIEVRGADPASILVLTFSRKAAEQLRDRITARLRRTVGSPIASTFHSFAFGLVRAFTPHDLYAAPLRLLSAPQADVMVRELLELHRDELPWPEGLAVAARTRGFAREVAAVIARVREKGADHEELFRLSGEVPEFLAAGIFLRHYLDSLDDHSATDYPDLMRRAVIEAHEQRDRLRRDYQHVFVDEYQDTDPGQVALLQALAGDGRDLVVVGDPHQSIYGFRGADVRGILDFPSTFPRRDRSPAPTVVLGATRRFGPRLLEASQRVARNLPLTGAISAPDRDRFSDPSAEGPGSPGIVEVATFDTDRAEIEHIADLLRRAHLEEGMAWSDMAILVRSGRAILPVLRRMLAQAGVPVEVAADEIPLAEEPGIRPLLEALAIATDLADPPSAESAEALFVSPLGRLDATGLRTLGRALRHRELAESLAEGRPARGSGDLVATTLVRPDLLDGLTSAPAVAARQLAGLIGAASAALADGVPVEQVLWQLWVGTDWGQRLRASVDRGGPGARRAHRDLDAVCALFDVAAKAEDQRGHTSAVTFLEEIQAQQIPGDTLAERGLHGDTVRLLTAHRSKGLEWPLVVVAHVQEGSWPDLRRRTTLLGGDRLGLVRYGELDLQPDVTLRALLAEERRLFYVACTRARERLVVTAVASTADEGDEPSRFLEELAGAEPRHVQGRPPRPLTLPGIVSELRRCTVAPDSSPALQRAAARRLAGLAREERGGRPVVAAADPANWWGTHPRTHTDTPVRAADLPMSLSASAVTTLAECPAKWFLEREAGGSSYSGQAAGFGNLVHKIAEHVGSGRLTDPDIDDLMTHVDAVWDQLPFRTPWSRNKEREEAKRAISRFLAAHRAPGARQLIATEHEFSLEIELPDGEKVLLRGFADRVELDADGGVLVVDLKTGKYTPTAAQLQEHLQLGLYQLAVNSGAVDDLLPEGSAPAVSAGAELWQLRMSRDDAPKFQVQEPQVPDDDGWVLSQRQVSAAVQRIRSEEFPAIPSDQVCRICPFRSLCPAHSTKAVIR